MAITTSPWKYKLYNIVGKNHTEKQENEAPAKQRSLVLCKTDDIDQLFNELSSLLEVYHKDES